MTPTIAIIGIIFCILCLAWIKVREDFDRDMKNK
jgi:type IV secretory pathway VirB2 component (pilin)